MGGGFKPRLASDKGKRMSYWTEQVNRLWDEWITLTKQESGNPSDFIEWATENKKLALCPQDMKQLLRKQVTEALRQKKLFDEEGCFTYRAKQSVTLFDGGTPVKHYFDTDKGGTPLLRQKSTKQRREAIAHDVYRGVCDVERMNKVFREDPQLSFPTDFSDDVAELRIAERLEHDTDDDD
jgi:hypothetical protein